MSRYIDADDLKNKILEDMVKAEREGKDLNGYTDALFHLKTTPTADVVEVRHGEWKKVYEKAPRYVCTSCNHLYNNKGYKYCPECGAKMDGERSNENGLDEFL